MYYTTTYTTPSGFHRSGDPREKYMSHVWAKTEAQARALMQRRNLGERFYWCPTTSKQKPHLTASELLKECRRIEVKSSRLVKLREALHAVVYESSLAAASGVIPVQRLLGDTGLVHMITHVLIRESGDWGEVDSNYNHFTVLSENYKEFVVGVMRMETLIPGYLSDKDTKKWLREIRTTPLPPQIFEDYKV